MIGLLQAGALAQFEATYGQSQPVPPGPRRDRLVRTLEAEPGDMLVQSGPSCLEPTVAAIGVDGGWVETDDVRSER